MPDKINFHPTILGPSITSTFKGLTRIRPLSCGFDSSVGRALHWHRRGRGFESRSEPEFFSGLCSSSVTAALSCGFDSSVGRALHWHRRGRGFESRSEPEFFSGLCSSSVTAALALMTVSTQLLLMDKINFHPTILGPSITSTFKGLTRIRPLSCGFDSSVGRALHWHRRGRGFESRSEPEFFSGLCSSSVTAALALMTVSTQLLLMDKINFHPTILGPSITSTFKGLTRIRPLSCGFDSSVGRALHWHRRGRGFESRSEPEFFSGLCSSSVTAALALMTVSTQLLLMDKINFHSISFVCVL